MVLSNGCEGAVDVVDFSGLVFLDALKHGGVVVSGFMDDVFGLGDHVVAAKLIILGVGDSCGFGGDVVEDGFKDWVFEEVAVFAVEDGGDRVDG